MFFMAGMPWLLDPSCSAASAPAASLAAYTVLPHVAGRIDRFLDRRGRHVPGRHGPRLPSILGGGWFGRGPGEGTIKRLIPDSHTDFIFSVAGGGIRHPLLHRACRSSPSSCCAASATR
jgi:cell division protein FtsW